jgi:hypothetical protein
MRDRCVASLLLLLWIVVPVSAQTTYLRYTADSDTWTTVSPPFDSSSNCVRVTDGHAHSGTGAIKCDVTNPASFPEGLKVLEYTQNQHTSDAGGAYVSAWYYLDAGFQLDGIWRNNFQFKPWGQSAACPTPNGHHKTIIGFGTEDALVAGVRQVTLNISTPGTWTINDTGTGTGLEVAATGTSGPTSAKFRQTAAAHGGTGPKPIPFQTWFHLEAYYKGAATNGAIKLWQDGVLIFDISGANFNTLTTVPIGQSCTTDNPWNFWGPGSYTDVSVSGAQRLYMDDMMVTNFQVSAAPPATPQAFLSANPPTIIGGTGTNVILTWGSLNATNCSIDQGVGQVCNSAGTCDVGGTQTIIGGPAIDTTYTVSCTGPGGGPATQAAFVDVTQSSSITGRKRYAVLKTGTPPTIDGAVTEFQYANWMRLHGVQSNFLGRLALMWDATALYGAAMMTDTDLGGSIVTQDGAIYDEDSWELWFDADHNFGPTMDDTNPKDFKIILSLLNTQYDEVGVSVTPDITFTSAAVRTGTANNSVDTDTGYIVEWSITWANLSSCCGISGPSNGTVWGFDTAFNDARPATTSQGNATFEKLVWANLNGASPNDPDGWGELVFSNKKVRPYAGVGR